MHIDGGVIGYKLIARRGFDSKYGSVFDDVNDDDDAFAWGGSVTVLLVHVGNPYDDDDDDDMEGVATFSRMLKRVGDNLFLLIIMLIIKGASGDVGTVTILFPMNGKVSKSKN